MNPLTLWTEFKNILSNRPEELSPLLNALGFSNEVGDDIIAGLRKIGFLDALSLKKLYFETRIGDERSLDALISGLKLDQYLKAADLSLLLRNSADSEDSTIAEWVSTGGYKTLFAKLTNQTPITDEPDAELVACDVCYSSVPIDEFCSECGAFLESS